MPTVGDTAHASEIGRVGTHYYTYYPCPDCGDTRWLVRKQITQYGGRCTGCAGLTRRGTRLQMRGANNPAWRGGRTLLKTGYIRIPIYPEDPLMPMATHDWQNSKYHITEHRYVMAQHLGRCLESWEVVHHLNGDRTDNRIENLEILPDRQTHMAFTLLQQENEQLRNEINRLRAPLADGLALSSS